MSHSVPSDSSTADTSFVVGADLVEFDRHDLPIYLAPETRGETYWADAGHDVAHYGAPLDRLFGEPGEVFISMSPGAEEATAAATAFASVVDDPTVLLSGLADGLILPACEHMPAAALADPVQTQEMAIVFHFGADPLPMHDAWAWDLAKPEWLFDHHA
jgi:hypothetical protein